MDKIGIIILQVLVISGCAPLENRESLSPNEIQFEKDRSYCEAYAEFPVTTHPNYIKCMKDRGWELDQ